MCPVGLARRAALRARRANLMCASSRLANLACSRALRVEPLREAALRTRCASCLPQRPTAARFRRSAFMGGRPWQYSRAMRSRAAIRGNFLASCIPEGAPDGKSAPPWQRIAAMHPKRAGFGKIRAPCIRKAPQTAFRECIARRSCQEGALFAARIPRIMHTAQILPSVAAEQRERSQARRRLYGAAEQGAGGFLSGVVARPREFVALWGVEC